MYICIMLRYKKGDIVICVTNKMYGMKYLLEVGEQYQIDDCIEIGGNVFGSEKNLVSVSNVKTGEDIGVQKSVVTLDMALFDDKHFIPMDVWREFQLRKILE